MPNYYEILEVETTAKVAEIEAAIDHRYNQWRLLVTHHDPQVVAQANQALQALETIRTTLTDPSKRSAYDAGIGIGGTIGGLIDPSAIASSVPPVFTPPPPRVAPQPSASPLQSTQRVDAWVCPKCQTANPVQTRFCIKCGQSLARDCPKCGKTIQIVAEFCPECGVNFAQAEKQRALEEQRRVALQRREAERTAILGPMTQAANSAWSATKWGCILIFIPYVGILLSLPLWIVGLVRALRVKNMSQIEGDTTPRSQANKALWLSVIPLVIMGVGIALYVLMAFCSILGSVGRR